MRRIRTVHQSRTTAMGDGIVDLVADNPSAEILDVELEWNEPRDRAHRVDTGTRRDRIRDWRGERRPHAARRLDARWLIAAAALIFVIWVLSGGDTTRAPASPASDATPQNSDGAASSATQPDPALDLEASIAGLTAQDLVTAWLEVQVDPDEVDKYALLRPVQMVPSDYRFAYMGADGFPVLIDLGTGELVSVRDETRASGDGGEAVLATSDGALGFDPADPTRALRLATGVQLVRRHTGELLVLVSTDDGVEYGEFVPGFANERSLLPGGTDIEIVPGVGAFVTAQTGGTLEVTGSGLERISPHEVVATNGSRWLEYRRSTIDANQMVVTSAAGADGVEYTLDNDLLDFGLGPSISPDGAWIFLPKGREYDDFPALYEIETGTLLDFEQRVQGLEPLWAPDSSFVAMIDPGRDCIYLFFVTGNNGCISLSRLQIPAIEDSNLVIVDAAPETPDIEADSATDATSP